MRAALFTACGLASAATVLLPVGLSGLVALGWMVLAAAVLALRGPALPRAEVWAVGAFLAWMAASSLWSPAGRLPMLEQMAHLMVLLAVPLMAATLPPAAAPRALGAFVASALLLAALWAWHDATAFTPPRVLASLVVYVGNKSIVNGALVALAAGLLAHAALGPLGAAWRLHWRALAMLGALWLAGSVLWHAQTRSAHLLVAVLAGLLVWLHLRSWRWRLAGVALVTLTLWLWLQGSGQHIGGLAARAQAGQLDDSSGQRLAVYAETLRMVSEAPLAGHGLAAWAHLWPQRAPRPDVQPFNTAHSVPLEVAAEGGGVALALLLAVVALWWRRAAQGEPRGAGGVALLVGATWAVLALFNAALRDSVLAAPMVVLLGVALAGIPPPPHAAHHAPVRR